MTKALSTKCRSGELLSPAVKRFARIMQDRLDGSGRSGFQNCSTSSLLESMRRNVRRLEAELLDLKPHDADENVSWPCADIANYAMFLALNNIFRPNGE